MNSKFLCILASMCCIANISAQNYINKKFGFSVEKNIIYGTDTDYQGFVDTLKLDLYKPVSDSNCLRPVMLVVHGGSWIGGDKGDGGIVAVCKEFVQRGYVVASLNYRMGMQPAANYVPYAVCPHAICSYAADTAEFYRAMYRAMQDVKGAVRFLKNRSTTDSSDAKNVFLLGESAGAFTVVHAAFTDRDQEKPPHCFSLTDAPTPDSDLQSCVSSQASRKRPDLGNIHGSLHLQGADEKVQGVAAFFGGALDMSIWKNSLASDTPALYLYHQTCDVVIDNNTGRVFWKVFYHCYAPLNLCMPFSAGPVAYGSTTIKNYFDTSSQHVPSIKYTLLTDKGAYSCNPGDNCHGTDNIPLRCAEVAAHFSSRIAASGNVPTASCKTSVFSPDIPPAIRFYYDPETGMVNLKNISGSGLTEYFITNMQGQILYAEELDVRAQNHAMRFPEHLRSGMYCVCLGGAMGLQCIKVVR